MPRNVYPPRPRGYFDVLASRTGSKPRRAAYRNELASYRAQVTSDLSISIANAASVAILNGMKQAEGLSLDLLAEAAAKFNSVAAIDKIHMEVGRAAQQSILNSYAQVVTARKKSAGRTGYREGLNYQKDRLANGKLRQALGDKGHVRVSNGTLLFLDYGILDKKAAHWYRLNFGVGQRGAATKQNVFDLFINGQTVGQLGLTTGPSLKPMIIPKGFFVDAEGKRAKSNDARRGEDRFYPVGQAPKGIRGRPNKAKISRGITGRNFLDAGIFALSRELPKKYDDFIRESLVEVFEGRVTRERLDQKVAAPRVRRKYASHRSKFTP